MRGMGLRRMLSMAVNTALSQDGNLAEKISPNRPQKAAGQIEKYIKSGWKIGRAQRTVDQLAQAGEIELRNKASKKLAAMKEGVAKQVGLYPYLAKSPEVKAAVQEFSQKANRLIEEFKKPVIEKKRVKPGVLVPL